ncbi:MAG: bacillithiol biosynthesis deacetylase BshB1 [bacterium]|nr:bacillithiol biosynthesis deacetylase BshB1 [bacterium]
MHPKINVLAFAAHPDDVEIGISGTMIKHKKSGLTTGVIDLTRGELGTRGTAEIRAIESANASKILQLDVRENLDLKDGFFEYNESNLKAVAKCIRKYQPEIVLCNAFSDRHPDHGKGHRLVADACFLAGLLKVEIQDEQGNDLKPWRPNAVYAYIQDNYLEPDFVIDVTEFWEERTQSLMCFKSQFFNPDSKEPETPISSLAFLQHVEGRSVQFGRFIGVKYAEGFNVVRPAGVNLFTDLI